MDKTLGKMDKTLNELILMDDNLKGILAQNRRNREMSAVVCHLLWLENFTYSNNYVT